MIALYWMLAVLAVAVLWWMVSRNNRGRSHDSSELSRENDQLRQVIIKQTLERHFGR
ncbi:MAG: hypothetical protein WDN03_01480 [Rhizomicrobium sp.]